MDSLLLIFLAVVGLSVLLFEMSMLRTVYGDEERHKRHLKNRIVALKQKVRDSIGDSLLKRDAHQDLSFSDKLFSNFPGTGVIRKLINQSGQEGTVGGTVMKCLLIGLFAALFAWLYSRSLYLAGPVALAGASVPLLILSVRRKRRLQAFDEQLAEALDIVIRGLRAGHGLDASMKLVTEELPAPISDEFAIVHAESTYGVPLKVALTSLLERTPSRFLNMFVTSVMVQRETGGNLTEILENVSRVIRGGFKFQRKVKTLAAEGKVSMKVIASVPIVLTGVMFMIQPQVMENFFLDQRGQDMVKGAMVMYVLGFVWATKIVRIDY